MKFIRRLIGAVLLVVIAVLICAILATRLMSARPEPPIVTRSAGPTIEAVKALAELTTLRVEADDAQVTELHGHVGSVRAIVIVRGDVTIAVDLSAAKFESVNESAKHAILILPQPTLQSARLDHERTRLLAIQSSGLWAITPGGAEADAATINHALRDAQRTIGDLARDAKLLDRARRQAEQVLKVFFKAMDWQVEVRWP